MFPPEIASKILDFPDVLPPGVTAQTDVLSEGIRGWAKPGELGAVALPGTEQPGYSPAYRNARIPELLTGYHPEINTLYEIFLNNIKRVPDANFLGNRTYDHVTKTWSPKYYFQTYKQAHETSLNFANGLVTAVQQRTGRLPAEQYIVSMYMPNCPQWVITDLACMSQSIPSVCLYDTLGPDTSEYILNFCESPVIIASLANVPKVLQLKSKLPKLAVIICSEELSNDFDRPGEHLSNSLLAWANEAGVALYSFNETVELGTLNPLPIRPPTVKDIYAINFTSGTTGKPKGAILAHSNIISAVSSIRSIATIPWGERLTVFSFLPLAHIFERISMGLFISVGASISFPHGSILELFEDIQVARPHMMNMVPRVLNRMAGVLKAATIEAPGITGALSRRALKAKLDRLHATGSPNHPIWDRLWSNKIAKKVGLENLYFLVTGSAPLAPSTLEFLKVILGTEVIQGYGLTESMAGSSMCSPHENDAGSIGVISPGNEFRFRDVPELNYRSSDKPRPRGELMLRGPQIFKGYYKNNEKTDEAIDKDGWFYTGDVAAIDEKGRLYIIDRVKNFFKLAQGEYVAAEKIENVYLGSSAIINQIFVHGNSHESFLVALAAVNPDSFAQWLSKHTGKHIAATAIEEMNELGKDTKIRQAFLHELNKSLPKGALQGFEKVKNVHFGVEPMTIENGCLTPTMKIMRPATIQFYKDRFDSMYSEGPLPETSSKL